MYLVTIWLFFWDSHINKSPLHPFLFLHFTQKVAVRCFNKGKSTQKCACFVWLKTKSETGYLQTVTHFIWHFFGHQWLLKLGSQLADLFIGRWNSHRQCNTLHLCAKTQPGQIDTLHWMLKQPQIMQNSSHVLKHSHTKPALFTGWQNSHRQCKMQHSSHVCQNTARPNQHSSVNAETATFFICVLNSLDTKTAMAKLSLHCMPKHGQTKFNTKHWPQHGILQSWQLVHSSLHQNIAMVNLMLFSACQNTAMANLMLCTACQNSHENSTCFPGCWNTLQYMPKYTTPLLAAETQPWEV